MRRCAALFFVLIVVLSLFAGCKASDPEPVLPTVPPTEPTQATEPATEAPTEPEPTVEETTPPETFIAYQLTIASPKLAVHAGPGYSYDITEYLTDQGAYIIIAHEVEDLGNNLQTTWGKLQTKDGWINLDDAMAGGFASYTVKLKNSWVEVFDGPGYGYDYVQTITDKGTYTIVEESIQYFTGGRSVTWGKLKSGVGWICLDDAELNPELPPPHRCTECGRADVSISRYALCDACYAKVNPAPYGTCAVCGDALTYTECEDNDGFVCNDCLVCGWCGDPISIMDVTALGTYMCWSCYEDEYCCHMCGDDCSSTGLINGLCYNCNELINTVYCIYCGNPCYSWDEGNVCSDCLAPEDP